MSLAISTPSVADRVIAIGRLFDFVREAQELGQNRGQRVEAIQHWSGGQPGDSWCCDWATMVLDMAYKGSAPLPRTGSCQAIYQLGKLKKMLSNTPRAGDLYLYVNGDDIAHHVGIVTCASPLIGIAGNTSLDGKSDNGTGVFEHVIDATVFVRYAP